MRLHDISHLFRDILPWPPGLTRYEQISPESHVDRGPDSHVQQGKRRLQCPWAHSFSGIKFQKQTWRFPWTWHCSVVCDCSGNSWIESAYASFFPQAPKVLQCLLLTSLTWASQSLNILSHWIQISFNIVAMKRKNVSWKRISNIFDCTYITHCSLAELRARPIDEKASEEASEGHYISWIFFFLTL